MRNSYENPHILHCLRSFARPKPIMLFKLPIMLFKLPIMFLSNALSFPYYALIMLCYSQLCFISCSTCTVMYYMDIATYVQYFSLKCMYLK